MVGATNPVLTIPAVTLAMNGANFRVAISNATSFAISSNAVLTVLPDISAPVLLGAVITTNGTVKVTFSEAVSTVSGTLLSNYRITNSAGANISISGAVISENTNVILTVAGLPANIYTLVVSNVQDRALAPNAISPNPSIARIGYEGPLVILGLTGSWKYEQSGTDLGTAWRAVGYNDSAWPSGQAIFGLEPDALPAPNTIQTPLTLGFPTYYFRTLTNSPTGGSRAVLRFRMLLDDGAVFYLNGVEIHRVRFAAAAVVNYGTFAANADPERVFETFDVVVTNLVAGPNLFAVEVHNTSATSTDIVFGNEVTLLRVDSSILSVSNICTYLPTWPSILRLSTNDLRQGVSHSPPNTTTFVLSWSNPVTNSCGSNAVVVLQRTTALLNPAASTVWTNVFTNNFGFARVTNTVTGTNAAFYRLRVQ